MKNPKPKKIERRKEAGIGGWMEVLVSLHRWSPMSRSKVGHHTNPGTPTPAHQPRHTNPGTPTQHHTNPAPHQPRHTNPAPHQPRHTNPAPHPKLITSPSFFPWVLLFAMLGWLHRGNFDDIELCERSAARAHWKESPPTGTGQRHRCWAAPGPGASGPSGGPASPIPDRRGQCTQTW